MIHANTVFLLIRLLCCLGSALAAETKAGGRRGENYPAPHRANSIGSICGVSPEPPPHPFPFLPSTLSFPLVRPFSISPSAIPLSLLPTKNAQIFPLFSPMGTSWGLFPRTKELTCPCMAGGPVSPPSPSQPSLAWGGGVPQTHLLCQPSSV